MLRFIEAVIIVPLTELFVVLAAHVPVKLPHNVQLNKLAAESFTL